MVDSSINTYILRELMEKKIVLSLACLLIGIGLAIAQTPKTVTGLVIFEEDNQPIVGASVLIKGTNQGAVTDLDGKFTLTIGISVFYRPLGLHLLIKTDAPTIG